MTICCFFALDLFTASLILVIMSIQKKTFFIIFFCVCVYVTLPICVKWTHPNKEQRNPSNVVN